jgi:hypothetical protein
VRTAQPQRAASTPRGDGRRGKHAAQISQFSTRRQRKIIKSLSEQIEPYSRLVEVSL